MKRKRGDTIGNLPFIYQENVIVVQINEKYLTNREHIFDIEESEQYFVDVEEILTKDGKLEIVYHRPNGYTPLLELKEYADFYKLDIVNRLLEMNVLEKTNTYLAMQNILLKDTRDLLFIYKADHFGNLPYSTKEELEQWKNFICSFFGKYTLEKYEKNRIEVLAKEKNSFLNDIEAVESLESLRDLIKNRLTEEQKNFFSTELQDKKADVRKIRRNKSLKIALVVGVIALYGGTVFLMKVPLVMLLDEFVNLGYFPTYENFLATCRGYRISVSTILQSLPQGFELYGDKKFKAIIGNHAIKICLGGVEETTAEYFSRQVNDTTIKVYTGGTSS